MAIKLVESKNFNLNGDSQWTKKKLSFTDAPMKEVIKEINRNTPFKLFIEDPRVTNMRISAYFKSITPTVSCLPLRNTSISKLNVKPVVYYSRKPTTGNGNSMISSALSKLGTIIASLRS